MLSRGDGAAEQVGDLAADRQTQPGATVLAAGGAVGLLERTEDHLQLLLGDADAGVDDPQGDGRAVRAHRGGQLGRAGRLDP